MAEQSTSQHVFHFNEDEPNFESFAEENGFRFWYARTLMSCLGYTGWDSFQRVMNQAMQILNTLGMPIQDHIMFVGRTIDGKQETDAKLSRVACYYIAMRADARKPEVAGAINYFATIAGAIRDHFEQIENADRIAFRGEITEREKSLTSTAKQAGVVNYAYFQNARYVGLYNRSIAQLRQLRGIDSSRTPLDYMGKDELAANLFAMSQTELKIKADRVSGQGQAEEIAREVGKKVRESMISISGVAPPRHCRGWKISMKRKRT